MVDVDDKAGTQFDPLGSAEFEMGRLIGSNNGMLILPLLEKGKTMGNVIIRSEKVASNNDILYMQYSLRDVASGGFCTSGKVFVE